MAYITSWFKIIKDEELIGVTTNQTFARYSSEFGRVHVCDVVNAQYLIFNDKFYRDDWMLALDPNSYVSYEIAKIISISEKEYDILSKTDSEVEPLNVNLVDEEVVSEKSKSIEEIVTIDAVRSNKISELSKVCEKTIENGFDLVLCDGVSHHFSMTQMDQINLINLELALDRGEDVMYHADGELIQYYNEEDANAIISGAHKWSMYNRTLFNSFKHWINNLNNISEISAITYDSEIPDEYCTNALQTLTENF